MDPITAHQLNNTIYGSFKMDPTLIDKLKSSKLMDIVKIGSIYKTIKHNS